MEEEKNKLKKILDKIKDFYDRKYKKLMIIPILLLILAIGQITYQTITTGDFLNKGVSLKGGITLTIPTKNEFDIKNLEKEVSSDFPKNDISVRSLSRTGSKIGIVIEADINPDNKEELESFLSKIETLFNIKRQDYVIEIVGSSLGRSFFRETFFALLLAFVFMSIVVFLYFKSFVPSIAVILCVLSDIIVTLAIINIVGIKLSTAGIATFLMLIGYSVDTDILLSSRVLRTKEISVSERIFSAIKTGVMMTLTAIAAATVGYLFTKSDVIKQMMIILIIGLVADLIYTWIQNVGILRIYVDKKKKKVSESNE